MRFGRYVLDERIGKGGMAEVFRARLVGDDGSFEKTVCVKRILPHLAQESGFTAMFRDEAAIAARLQHANIVQVFDFGEVDGALFIAMEYVEGASLWHILHAYAERLELLPVPAVLQIGVEICKGLSHAHAARGPDGKPLDLVHRDVTPSNIMLSTSGEVKIADFGIARAAGRRTQTRAGVVKGKLNYMAPEQVLNEPFDHRLDQFATGVVLWEAVTGQRLFGGQADVDVVAAIARHRVPRPSSIRPGLAASVERVIGTALAHDPAQRFSDMRAFGAALEETALQVADNARQLRLAPIVARALDPNPPPAPVDTVSVDASAATRVRAPRPIPTIEAVPDRATSNPALAATVRARVALDPTPSPRAWRTPAAIGAVALAVVAVVAVVARAPDPAAAPSGSDAGPAPAAPPERPAFAGSPISPPPVARAFVMPPFRETESRALLADCQDARPVRVVRAEPLAGALEIHVVQMGNQEEAQVISSRAAPHVLAVASSGHARWRVEHTASSGLVRVVLLGSHHQTVSGLYGVETVDLTRENGVGVLRFPEPTDHPVDPVFASAEAAGKGRIASYLGCEVARRFTLGDGDLDSGGLAIAAPEDRKRARSRVNLILAPPDRCARACPQPLSLRGFPVKPDRREGEGGLRWALLESIRTDEDVAAMLAATERCAECARSPDP